MQGVNYFLENEIGLPKAMVPKVLQFYSEEFIKKNTFITRQGKSCRKLCIIEEGFLRFFSTTESKEITHWIFEKNQIVTDGNSFFLGHPSKWNIQAIVDTKVSSISLENYQQLCNEIPEWNYYEKVFLVKLLSGLENRVYSLLSMTSEERYTYLFTSNKSLFKNVPLQYIASMLGMTPETLSRIRKK